MSNLALIEATMTSQEIAALTGREHKNVLRDIREMLEELGIPTAQFRAVVQTQAGTHKNREIEIFKLPPREVMILVTGYSVLTRARVIDKVKELEQQQNNLLMELEIARRAPIKKLWSVQEFANLMQVPCGYNLLRSIQDSKMSLGDNLQRVDHVTHLTAEGVSIMAMSMTPRQNKEVMKNFLSEVLPKSTNPALTHEPANLRVVE